MLPPPVAPHPDVDLVQTTSFSVVGPAIGGCSERREGTEAVRYGRVRVACEEAWDHRNPTQNILDMAEVETRYGSTTGGVVEHGHISPLHDAAWRKVHGLKRAEEGQRHFQVAPEVVDGAGRTQGAPEQ